MASFSNAPAIFVGVSRAPGGLGGLTFSSSCPPVIQPNTRIIGLCGTTDVRGSFDDAVLSDDEEAQSSKAGASGNICAKGRDILWVTNPPKTKREERKGAKMLQAHPDGLASPKRDGWFLSDFYLFHHLYRGLGASQRWYTCEDPRLLVSRYGLYMHGEAGSDHRIVLDKNMLGALQVDGDIHVSLRASLLQDFLDHVKAECRIASEKRQPVLVLIFGHGDKDGYGISIGGGGDPDSAPRLRHQHLEILTRGLNIYITLLTTACYSGGWLIQPGLNISALTAADSESESWAWKASLGASYHGSIWATAVMETLIKMEDPKTTQFQSNAPTIEVDDLDQDAKSATFVKLAEAIRRTLKTEGNGQDIHQISFSAQDDGWAQEWRKESGVPLGTFEERWEKLPRRPAQAIVTQRPPITGSTQSKIGSSPEQQQPQEHNNQSMRRFTSHQNQLILADKCRQYLNSFPGIPQSSSDIRPFHAAKTFLASGSADTMNLPKLQAVMDYRLNAMLMATTLKDIGLPPGCEFPPCNLFDNDTWRDTLSSTPRTPENTKRSEIYRLVLSKIFKANLCGTPTIQQGPAYSKPDAYLAAAFVENRLDEQSVDKAIAAMQAYKNSLVMTMTKRVRLDRSVRSTAGAAFRSLGKRLRSPSPRKRGAISRFSAEVSSH